MTDNGMEEKQLWNDGSIKEVSSPNDFSGESSDASSNESRYDPKWASSIVAGVIRCKDIQVSDRLSSDTRGEKVQYDTNEMETVTNTGSETTGVNVEGYQPKWASSQSRDEVSQETDKNDVPTSDDYLHGDELPIFADDTSKRLHQQIKKDEKMLEIVTKSTKEHVGRIKVMSEHLQNVRQEIDHTNGLVLAKKKEFETEEHLSSLEEREQAVVSAEIKQYEESFTLERNRFKSLQKQIFTARQEMEKIKLALNWNQEELEQWATAAAKKEEDNIILEKYTRSDEVKIKELLLRIENLTKMSVDKQVALENEVTDTQSRRIELDKIADNFRAQHNDRRHLILQWQETIEAMKVRDNEINDLTTKYAEAQSVFDKELKLLAKNREQLALIESEKQSLNEEIDATERFVQSKRQERVSSQQNQQALRDELDVLKLESIASVSSLQKSKAQQTITEGDLHQKTNQMNLFRERCDIIKQSLEAEKKTTLSREKIAQNIEQRLKEREKENKLAENQIKSLKDQVFKDSQRLGKLRQAEDNLISEIRSSQATAKNLSTKIHHLEKEHSKQQDLIYNAEFQVQQMERKVARGLGERSDEEKKQLQKRIGALEEERDTQREKKRNLTEQCRIVQQELRRWQRKLALCSRNQKDVQESIAEVELEISSCELNLKQIIARKEESMVSQDIVCLEVKRLRDILRSRVSEICSLEDRREDLIISMTERKEHIKVLKEVKTAQLRAAEDERHKSALELGQRKVVSEKMKLKHEMLTKAHRTDCDDGGEEHSHVYYLITAAQKRAELQREGDRLDNEIQKKEKEIQVMEKTLLHLRERNTDFRKSFSKADANSDQAQEVRLLSDQVNQLEVSLFETKKEFKSLLRSCDEDGKRLSTIKQQTSQLEEENKHLGITKKKIVKEVGQHSKHVEASEERIHEESLVHRKRDYPTLHLNEETSLQEKKFQAEAMEKQAGHIIRMLKEIGQEFSELKNDIVSSLVVEGIMVE